MTSNYAACTRNHKFDSYTLKYVKSMQNYKQANIGTISTTDFNQELTLLMLDTVYDQVRQYGVRGGIK